MQHDKQTVEEKKPWSQTYLVYQPIIDYRSANALLKLKRCFNFTNSIWEIKKGTEEEKIKTRKRELRMIICNTEAHNNKMQKRRKFFPEFFPKRIQALINLHLSRDNK